MEMKSAAWFRPDGAVVESDSTGQLSELLRVVDQAEAWTPALAKAWAIAVLPVSASA